MGGRGRGGFATIRAYANGYALGASGSRSGQTGPPRERSTAARPFLEGARIRLGYCGNKRAIQIYTILARYTDSRHKAFPSRATLAERAQCSQDTVDRAIKFLSTLGALTYIPGGPGRANMYTLKVAALTRVQVAAPTRVGSRTDAGTGSRTHAAPTKTINENHEPDIAISRSRWKNSDYWDAIETVFNHRPRRHPPPLLRPTADGTLRRREG